MPCPIYIDNNFYFGHTCAARTRPILGSPVISLSTHRTIGYRRYIRNRTGCCVAPARRILLKGESASTGYHRPPVLCLLFTGGRKKITPPCAPGAPQRRVPSPARRPIPHEPHRAEPAAERNDVLPHPLRRLALEPDPRHQRGDVSHICLDHAPARHLLGPDADAVEVALDRRQRQADAAEEDIRPCEVLRGALAAAEFGGVEGEGMALGMAASR